MEYYTIDVSFIAKDQNGSTVPDASTAPEEAIDHYLASLGRGLEIVIKHEPAKSTYAYTVSTDPTSPIGLIFGTNGVANKGLNLSISTLSESGGFLQCSSSGCTIAPVFSSEKPGTDEEKTQCIFRIGVSNSNWTQTFKSGKECTITFGSTITSTNLRVLRQFIKPSSIENDTHSPGYLLFQPFDVEIHPLLASNPESASAVIGAHKEFLCKYEYFRDMFQSGMIESSHSSGTEVARVANTSNSELLKKYRIALNLNASNLRGFIYYLYFGKVKMIGEDMSGDQNVPSMDAVDAWHAGQLFRIPSLSGLASRHIVQNLSYKHTIRSLLLSQEARLYPELKQVYSSYVLEFFPKIRSTGALREVLQEIAAGNAEDPDYTATTLDDLLSKMIQ